MAHISKFLKGEDKKDEKDEKDENHNTAQSPKFGKIARDQKICPFMSNPPHYAPCNSFCQLYRDGKDGYECPLSELSVISWNTKKPSVPKNFLKPKLY